MTEVRNPVSLRGRIVAVLWGYCDACTRRVELQAKTRTKAQAELRGQGWTFARWCGWRCQRCSEDA